MNFKTTGAIAFEIGIALLSGLAVFMGIEKATKGRKNNPPETISFNPEDTNTAVSIAPQQENVIEGGLKATLDICGKIGSVASSLIMVVENTRQIFSGGSYSQPYNSSWNYCGWGGCGPVQYGETTYRRIDPFIVEARPMNRPNGNYPF